MPTPDEFQDGADDWFELTPDSFPKVPRPPGNRQIAVRSTLALPILDTPGFQQRPEEIKAALVILSQSPTARRFAQAAIDAGYRIVVDPPVLSGAGQEYEDGTSGSTDHANHRINIRGGDNPLRLAIVLAHELTHVSQIIDGGLDMNITTLHPLSAIRQLLAMEGDARAHEFLIASELQYRTTDDPEERLVFPDALDVAADTIGVSLGKRVIEVAKPALENGDDKGLWMARIFKSFYASPDLRAHYESTIVHGIETYVRENPGALENPAFFRGDMPSAELISRIDGHGQAYLAEHARGYIDLDVLPMAGVSLRTQERLAALQEQRKQNPDVQNDASWSGPVYQLVLAKPVSAPRPPAP